MTTLDKRRELAQRQQLATTQIKPLDALSKMAGLNRVYEINLNDIIVDQEIQVRVGGLDAETLAQYIAVLENEGELPPITLFRDDAGEHYLADGFHRFRAHEVQGRATIKAYVKDGNRDAAIDYAESANLEHGLKLSPRDKKNILFRRIERGHEWTHWSTRELGRVLGVSHVTVKNWLEEFATVKNLTVKRTETVGADGRVYNTANIGKTPRAPQPKPAPSPIPDDLPTGFTYSNIDTGDGSASAIENDLLAMRNRGGKVRRAIQQITEGIDSLLQNHSVAILADTPATVRKDLIAALISSMVREIGLSQQLVNTLEHDDALDIKFMFVRVDNALDECAVALENKIAEI